MIRFIKETVVVISINGFRKIKEKTNDMFTLLNSLYNFIWKWKQHQIGWYFLKSYLSPFEILNISGKGETVYRAYVFLKNSGKNT